LVIDDGSSDNTRQIVEQLASQDPRIQYHYQSNKGRSAARNLGIRLAKGRYITFLDSDDLYLPHKIEREVEALCATPQCGLVFCGYQPMDEDGNLVSSINSPDYDFANSVYPDILFFRGTIVTTPSVMVKRETLRKVGGFDESMHMCEDLDLWRRVSRKTHFYQIKDRLICVRYRTKEKLPLWEFLRGREKFYQKAFEEDPSILPVVYKDLYTEMYWQYCFIGLKQHMFIFSLYLFLKLFLINPKESFSLANFVLHKLMTKIRSKPGSVPQA